MLESAALTEDKREKWYQDLFTSQRKKQEQRESRVETRNNYTETQKYYNRSADDLKRTIDQMEKRNEELYNSYRSQNRDRDFLSRSNFNNVPVVVPVPQQNRDDRTERELSVLRTEIANLRHSLNSPASAQRVDSVYQPVGDSSISATASVTDSLQFQQLNSQMLQIRRQIDSLRLAGNVSQPVVAEKPVPFDLSSFPIISVYFKLGSVNVSSDQLNKIAPFVKAAQKNKAAGIMLSGFTDPVGNAAKNMLIARQRSENVKKLLVATYNISSSRISIQPPTIAEADVSKKANPLDRRVDLQFDLR